MKKTKIALTLVCAILLVAASVMGTLAYLTATTETVTNTFTVGNVAFDGGLDEADVDLYGEQIYEEDGKTPVDRVTSNSYKLIPGHKYLKDPTIHMADSSENAYLFVKVENQISTLEATGDTTIAKQMEALGWKAVSDADNVYVYYGVDKGGVNATRAIVAAGDDVVVFNNFTLADTAKVDDVDEEGSQVWAGKTIKVTAYAIQADGMADVTDDDLWAKANPTT